MEIKTGSFSDENRNVLAGRRVALDSSFPALKPCRFCKHETGVLTGPSGPHVEGVRCEACYRHIGWLPPAYDLGADFSVFE